MMTKAGMMQKLLLHRPPTRLLRKLAPQPLCKLVLRRSCQSLAQTLQPSVTHLPAACTPAGRRCC